MRGDWFDSTGLPWTNPSPNMRSLTEAALYPGRGPGGIHQCFRRPRHRHPIRIAGCALDQGHGAGAISERQKHFRRALRPDQVHSQRQQHSGQKCEGVNIVLIERNALDAAELGIELASALHKLYPEQWHMPRMIELLDNQSAYDAVAAGQDPRRIAEDWRESLDKFMQVRQKYLIYK